MATSLTTSYAGEYKDKMIASALLSGRTLANGGLTVYPNVAFKEVIKRVDLGGDLITAGACDYADAGTVTIDEAVLEVKEFQINKTECKKTFSPKIGLLLKYGLLYEQPEFYLRAYSGIHGRPWTHTSKTGSYIYYEGFIFAPTH